jgi:hypothetical protein
LTAKEKSKIPNNDKIKAYHKLFCQTAGAMCNEDVYSSDFMRFFHGKFNIESPGEQYIKAATWALKDDEIKNKRKISVCIAFTLTPSHFTMTGKTKSGIGDGVGWGEQVKDFLPELTPDELSALSEQEKKDKDIARGAWPDWAQNLNRSKINAVAYLGAQYGNKHDFMVKKWRALFGDKPDKASAPDSLKEHVDAFRVIDTNLKTFQSHRDLWDIPEVKEGIVSLYT